MFEVVGIVIVCFVVADFLTGFFHWLEDTYCLDGMPFIGNLICEPNINHHLDPNLMVRTGTFIGRNLIQCLLSAFFGLVACWVGIGTWPVFLTLFLAAFGNEVHRWNHMTRANRFAEFLKDAGLVQSRHQHSMHHKPPFTSNYCILGSFMNAILERIRFWRRLEKMITMLSGIRPVRESRRDFSLGKKATDESQSRKSTEQNLAA